MGVIACSQAPIAIAALRRHNVAGVLWRTLDELLARSIEPRPPEHLRGGRVGKGISPEEESDPLTLDPRPRPVVSHRQVHLHKCVW